MTDYEGKSLEELQQMVQAKQEEVAKKQEELEEWKRILKPDAGREEEKKKRPPVDMNTWTPEQERGLRRELEKAVKYLAENGQETTVEELRRLWGVANAYSDEERNMKVDFEVHEVFAQILDKEKRQELLHSRDDWTPRTAQLAVDAWHQLPDGNRRLLKEED